MLERLFISKVRIKLLQQYLLIPNDGFHVRGLVRILDEEINAIRRELQNLESLGILYSEKKGNKLFYFLNPKSTYINELRSLVFKETDEGIALSKELSGLNGLDFSMVTQCFIEKKYENETDPDLLIVGNFNMAKASDILKSIEKILGKEMKVAAFTTDDFEFRLKKRDPYILNILKKDNIILYGKQSILAM